MSLICSGCDARITGSGRIDLDILPSDPDQSVHKRYFHNGQCLGLWLVTGSAQLTLARAFPSPPLPKISRRADETILHVPVRPVR
jgi:hypothetical protein